MNLECPVVTATTLHRELANQAESTEHDTTPPTRLTNNRLLRFNQVMEVASLQPQKAPRCLEQKDPLDKYSKGITKAIHDAYLFFFFFFESALFQQGSM